MTNKELVEKYPFLLPRNRWNDEELKDYDYSYTELDSMPDGWREAFGDLLLDELKFELEKANYLDDYRITEIKEKFGGLRWYDNDNTEYGRRILSKYSVISEGCCIMCGRPDVGMTNGYYQIPICKKCYESEGYNYDTYEEAVEQDQRIGDSYKITKFSKDGYEDIEYDISDTVRLVRERWNKKHPDDKVSIT